jgi:hypothetical protein
VEDAVQAGVDDRPPVGVLQPGQRLVPGDPRAAHHGLDRPEFLFDLPHPGGDLVAGGHVRLQGEHPRAELGRGLLDLEGGQLVVVMAEADVPAVLGQPADRGRADAPGSGGDQCHTAVTLAQPSTFPRAVVTHS